MLMLSGPVELLFLLFLIAVCTCSVVMFICVGCSLCTFLVVFSVCGAGLVRNGVDELFVECTCDVFGVDVCVIELLSCCGGRFCASPCIVFQ